MFAGFVAFAVLATLGPVGRGGESSQFTSWTVEPVRAAKTIAEASGPQPERAQLLEVNPRRQGRARRVSSGGDGPTASPSVGTGRATTVALDFDGIDFTGAFPPDTVGEAGTLHYVQMVNDPFGPGSRVGVYDMNTGAELANFVLSSIAPAGHPCQNGRGDPIVLFDQLTNRWVLTEFLDPDTANGVCLYMFDGDDLLNDNAVLYGFGTPEFPDYPKWSIWPNAIYFATNESDVNGPTPAVYAIDRSKVLTGQTTTIIRGTVPPLEGFGFQLVAPVDLDGTATPPAGAPGVFIRHRDDEAHNLVPTPGADSLEYFELNPNFGNPSNSTLVGPISVGVSEFSSELCGLFSFECIRQKKTKVKLDPLREVVMHRPLLRTFGTHQSLIGSFATDVTGTEISGVRWFELRRAANGTAGGWSLHQEGTQGTLTDKVSRWMSSIAMNSAGDIALGYSRSGKKEFPSIVVTGRTAADLPGTMPQGEAIIVVGKAQKKNGITRWGDYSAMSVDPTDDQTFWYTNEISGKKSAWSTRIAHFSLS